jgi:hypothetical protein
MKALGFNYKKFALENPGYFDAETQKRIAEGSVRAVYKEFYYNIMVSISGGKQKLVDESQPKALGITNLQNGKLVAPSNLLLLGIKQYYDSHAAETTVINRNWSNCIFSINKEVLGTLDRDAGAAGNQLEAMHAQDVPDAVLNATFRLNVDGDEKLVVDNRSFYQWNTVKWDIEGDFSGALSIIDNPLIINPDKLILPELEIPQGIVAPAGNHFIRTVLCGFDLVRR